jgi:RNA polymerase sigma-70 factor (ECF subfamily)
VLDDFLARNGDGLTDKSHHPVGLSNGEDLALLQKNEEDLAFLQQNGEDLALLQRVANGDQCAVTELYDAHGPLLFGLLVRILSQRAEAEDVLQDVFVEAWTQAHTYDPSRGTVVGWLCAIARNRGIDRLRARAADVQTAEAITAPLPPESTKAIASTGERNRDAHVALQSLPADERELIERAYFTGATQSEMADDLGLPLVTVKARVRAGLQTLRRVLDSRARRQ